MIKASEKEIGGRKVIFLDGTIEESFDPAALISSEFEDFEIDCRAIRRINSVGVKTWITYFSDLRSSGSKIRFYALPPALVEQANLISNFIPYSDIKSVALPFRCKTCEIDVTLIKDKLSCVGVDLDHVKWNCPTCTQANLEFDDIAKDYLTFWK